MSTPGANFPQSIVNFFLDAMHSGDVAKADRYNLMEAILDKDLSAAERRAVDELVSSAYRFSSRDRVPFPFSVAA